MSTRCQLLNRLCRKRLKRWCLLTAEKQMRTKKAERRWKTGRRHTHLHIILKFKGGRQTHFHVLPRNRQHSDPEETADGEKYRGTEDVRSWIRTGGGGGRGRLADRSGGEPSSEKLAGWCGGSFGAEGHSYSREKLLLVSRKDPYSILWLWGGICLQPTILPSRRQ